MLFGSRKQRETAGEESIPGLESLRVQTLEFRVPLLIFYFHMSTLGKNKQIKDKTKTTKPSNQIATTTNLVRLNNNNKQYY